MNLAETYMELRDDYPPYDPIKPTRRTTDLEVEIRTCGHSGNCPCGGFYMTHRLSFLEFPDGSVFSDDINDEEPFDTEDAMEESVSEYLAENYESEKGRYNHV